MFFFVPRENISDYREYNLKEAVGGHNAGDTVIFYMEYRTTDAEQTDVKLFVETQNIYLDKTDFYKKLPQSKTHNNMTFYFDIDAATQSTYVYFRNDSFGYNLEISATDKAVIEQMLETISEKN